MDSKRRMVEIHVWDQPFFSELSQTEKLLYWFMICKCDNVGVYRHNPKLAAFHCDCEGEINLQSFIENVNSDQKRLENFTGGLIWIKDFVRDTWGTIAAGNNLGVSCYKLLVKHGLLERFISEYPNSINIKSFRDAITEGRLELPLPQSSPKPDPENGVSEGYEGQSRGRAGTINITNSINEDISISNDPMAIAERVLRAYPKKNKTDNDISVMACIVEILEDLQEAGIKDPERYLLSEIKKMNPKEAPLPDVFFDDIRQGKEIPF